MASNVRFVDSLKVGAYNSQGSGGGGGITINNNINNYLLSATGDSSIINGEANLQFDGQTLAVVGNVTINDDSGNDLLLIKNASDKGLKVTSAGTLQLFEFTTLPAAIEGGIAYSSNEFYVGLG